MRDLAHQRACGSARARDCDAAGCKQERYLENFEQSEKHVDRSWLEEGITRAQLTSRISTAVKFGAGIGEDPFR